MKKAALFRTNRITAIFLMSIVFIMIISAGSALSYQNITIRKKSDIHWSEIRSDFQQKETKYQYIGVEKCASICHNNEKMGFQYDIWKISPHSDAFKSLVSKRAKKYAKKAHITENPQESSACLKCHVTGGELDSSFFTATFKQEEGVTCEACHKHQFVSKTYLPNEADCLNCHNDSLHKIQKFNFREKSAKIAHSRPTELIK